ncbi:MAG: DUF4115 domain-containing protein [bacterium]|nr:MAG: DUF4115 domain-containing protein [bacterium]
MNTESDSDAHNEGNGGDYLRGEETVGEVLLAARERSGLTLDEVSQETKVPKSMLEYLETDNFDAIPAKVYVKGFLRSYGSFLGLDIDYILNKYEVQTGQTHTSKGDLWEIETEVVEEELLSPSILKRYVLPVALLAIIVLVIWKFAGRKESEVTPTPPRPAVSEQVIEQEDEPIESRESQETLPAEETVSEPVIPLEPMKLQLIAGPADSVWFDLLAISAVDEKAETTAYDFILLPGESRSFEATEAFVLRTVGNAGGFDLELDGRRLARLGEKGRVVRNIKLTKEDLPSD